MASVLQLEFERLTNQARFISMIVSKELVVSSRKKADVIADLRKKDFRPFPKISKAKAAGETEEVVDEGEEEEEDDSNGQHDYDYLLNMAISSLTKERVRTTAFTTTSGHGSRRLCRSTNSGSRLLTRRPSSCACSS